MIYIKMSRERNADKAEFWGVLVVAACSGTRRTTRPPIASSQPVAMADSLSDPAFLSSPSRLSSLTPVESTTPPPRLQLTMSTRPKLQCYVAPPPLSPSVMELYQGAPEYLGGDPDFVRDDLDTVVGEYPIDTQGKPSHYFVRFKDGLARRVSRNFPLPFRLCAA